MVSQYEVTAVKQKYGIRYAVTYQGFCRAVKKTKEEAQVIADKFNAIRMRREQEGQG